MGDTITNFSGVRTVGDFVWRYRPWSTAPAKPSLPNKVESVTTGSSIQQDDTIPEIDPQKINANSTKATTRQILQSGKQDTKAFVYEPSTFVRDGVTLKIAQPKTGKFAGQQDLEADNYDPKFLLDQYTLPKAGRASLRLSLKSKGSSFEDKFYSKFFLEGISFSSNERVQMTETFESYVVSFRGTEPVTLQLKGTLLNAYNEDWLREFMRFYEAYKASSIALRDDVQNRLVTVIFENFQFSGYLFGFSTAIDASSEVGVPFQLSMLVSKTDIGEAVTYAAWEQPYTLLDAATFAKMQEIDRLCNMHLEEEINKKNPKITPTVTAPDTFQLPVG